MPQTKAVYSKGQHEMVGNCVTNKILSEHPFNTSTWSILMANTVDAKIKFNLRRGRKKSAPGFHGRSNSQRFQKIIAQSIMSTPRLHT
jgi:hypothetical protein